jgi:DNA-binding MarR family transcriptional regulator
MFSRFEALALLSFTRTGAMPMGRMGERLQVHPTSVTNTVDRLETEGLVTRIPHPTDRRTTLVEITPAGCTLVDRAAAALGDVAFGLDGMETPDLTAATNSLRSLRAAAGDF